MDVARRHGNVVRERAVVRHAEHAAAFRIPYVRVVAPAEHRIDHDLRTAGFENARTVGAERYRKLDSRIQSLRDKHITPVEGRRANAYENFAVCRLRTRDLLDDQVLRAADLVEPDGPHGFAHS